jgi:hypothetical protein
MVSSNFLNICSLGVIGLFIRHALQNHTKEYKEIGGGE